MAHDVFISYSIKDRLLADALCHKLEEDEIRCWIAPRDISPGGSWAGEIADAIPDSKIMILVFSSNANASKQVLREVELAITNNLTVIPMKIEDVSPTGGMSYYLSTTHWIDAIGKKFDKRISTLSLKIQAMLGIEKQSSVENALEKTAAKSIESVDVKINEAQEMIDSVQTAVKKTKKKNRSKPLKRKRKELWVIVPVSVIIILIVSLWLLSTFLPNFDLLSILPFSSPAPTWNTIPNRTPFQADEPGEDYENPIPLSEIPVVIAEDLGYEENHEVNFEDDNLKQAVADTLAATTNKYYSAEKITVGELLEMRYLFLIKPSYLDYYQNSEFNGLTESGLGFEVLEISSPDNLISLNGLQYAKNLLAIYVIGYEIADFSPISNLDSLRFVHLSTGDFFDPGVFQNLTNIQQLYLEGMINPYIFNSIVEMNGLTDLSMLYRSNQGMDITELVDGEYEITQSVSQLKGNVSIQKLKINNMMLTDIGFVTDMKKLISLDLADNHISDLFPLGGMEGLESLNLYNNKLTDTSNLSSLINLKLLNLELNPLEDIFGLRLLENLQELYMDFAVCYAGNSETINQLKYNGCAVYTRSKHPEEHGYDPQTEVSISNVDIINGIKENLNAAGYETGDQLTVMDIYRLENLVITKDGDFDEGWMIGMPVNFSHMNLVRTGAEVDLSFLKYAHNLKLLVVDEYNIDDISILSSLKNLMFISMVGNKITDITPLQRHKALRFVLMNSNNISDLSPIFSDSRSIHFVMLGNNQITDLSPITNCISDDFHHLLISNNNITDLSPLEKHTDMRTLDLSYNSIEDLSVLGNMKNLTELMIDSSTAVKNQNIIDFLAEHGCNIDIINNDE